MWKILKTYTSNFGGSKRTVVDVQCGCGSIETRRLDHVKSGRTSMCKSCSSKKTIEKHPMPINYKGIGCLSATLYHHYKRGANKRGIEFNVSMKYLYDLFENQDRKCALSGVELTMSSHAKNGSPIWRDITASLDRIDSTKGYIEGNVQWVHKTVNNMKMSVPQDEFIKFCILISIH